MDLSIHAERHGFNDRATGCVYKSVKPVEWAQHYLPTTMNGASERQALLPPPQTRHDSAVNEEAVDSVLERQEERARDTPLRAVVLVS